MRGRGKQAGPPVPPAPARPDSPEHQHPAHRLPPSTQHRAHGAQGSQHPLVLSLAQPQLSGLPLRSAGAAPGSAPHPALPAAVPRKPHHSSRCRCRGWYTSSRPPRATCPPWRPAGESWGRLPAYLLAGRGRLAGAAGVAAVGAVGHGSRLWLPGPLQLPLCSRCARLLSFPLALSPVLLCLPWDARWPPCASPSRRHAVLLPRALLLSLLSAQSSAPSL